ncbi:MAG: thioredoxin family protein [Leptolyngbya sp. ERB_1_1]
MFNRLVLAFVAVVMLCLTIAQPAWASLDDDRYDGEIFALYAGNGSLVPPKVSLADALNQKRPALLVFYTDDSKDCKRFANVISQTQAFYGRVIDILPIRVDSLPIKEKFDPKEAGYYYRGFVPQTVIFDQTGKVRLNETGIIPYEKIDDEFRQVFDLLPRAESVILKRRPVNEINSELVPQTKSAETDP